MERIIHLIADQNISLYNMSYFPEPCARGKSR